MAAKTVHVGIAYREQPGLRICPVVGGGLSVEGFREWLWDQSHKWVRVTLETLDGEPDRGVERRKLDRMIGRLMRHQERYVKAWVAATGLRPEESVLVQKHMPNGDIVMYVRKREVGER